MFSTPDAHSSERLEYRWCDVINQEQSLASDVMTSQPRPSRSPGWRPWREARLENERWTEQKGLFCQQKDTGEETEEGVSRWPCGSCKKPSYKRPFYDALNVGRQKGCFRPSAQKCEGMDCTWPGSVDGELGFVEDLRS